MKNLLSLACPLTVKRAMASCCVLVLGASTVQAQVPPIPSTAQPGRAGQQVQLPVGEENPGGMSFDVQQQVTTQAPPNAAEVRFTLASLEVEGMTVYSATQIRQLYDEFVGKEISLQVLYQIADRLTVKYRQDGYVLAQVRVPSQDFAGGNVKLVAAEGRIRQINYAPEEGARKIVRGSMIRRLEKNILASHPLNYKVLERNMRLLNELPGITAQALLVPVAGMPGEAELTIAIDRKRMDALIEADNRGSRYLGPLQGTLAGTLNGVFDETDSLGLQVNSTLDSRELRAGQANYSRMLTSRGLNVTLLGRLQETRPGYLLEDFDIKGKDKAAAMRFSYPLQRKRGKNTDVYASLESRDVTTDALGVRLTKDRLRMARLGISGNYADSLLGDTWQGTSFINLEATQGIDALGASKRGGDTTNPDAKPDFSKFTAIMGREQVIAGSRFSVFGSVSGQYAPNSTLSPEAFGVGGESFGSAYDSSELTGDSGWAARGELRYLMIPQNRTVSTLVKGMQPYAFVDYGEVYRRTPPPGVSDQDSLTSAGGGVRTSLAGGFNLALEVAQPLSKGVSGLSDKKFPRVFFKLSKQL